MVKKAYRTFSSLAIEHAHEQNDSVVKGDIGPIELINSSKFTRWMVKGSEMTRVIGKFEESVESIKKKQSKGPNVKHQEQVKSGLVTYAKHIKS